MVHVNVTVVTAPITSKWRNKSPFNCLCVCPAPSVCQRAFSFSLAIVHAIQTEIPMRFFVVVLFLVRNIRCPPSNIFLSNSVLYIFLSISVGLIHSLHILFVWLARQPCNLCCVLRSHRTPFSLAFQCIAFHIIVACHRFKLTRLTAVELLLLCVYVWEKKAFRGERVKTMPTHECYVCGRTCEHKHQLSKMLPIGMNGNIIKCCVSPAGNLWFGSTQVRWIWPSSLHRQTHRAATYIFLYELCACVRHNQSEYKWPPLVGQYPTSIIAVIAVIALSAGYNTIVISLFSISTCPKTENMHPETNFVREERTVCADTIHTHRNDAMMIWQTNRQNETTMYGGKN